RKIIDPLSKTEPAPENRIFLAQHLHGSLAPAVPLHGKAPIGLRRQSSRDGSVVVNDFPSFFLQPQARMHIFGDALGGKSTDLRERLPAQDSWTATIKGRVVAVFAGLNHAEKEFLLLPRPLLLNMSTVLKGIEIVEILRALCHSNRRVRKESDQLFNHVRHGNMIGIESHDEFPIRLLQRIV